MDELAELIAANASLVERHPEARAVISLLARFKVPARGWSSQTFAPKVPGLPTAGPRQLSRPPRVCIATSDLVGPVKNGGVGTACTTLAEALAEAGHEVTILYVGPFEAGTAADWRAHYRSRRISFEVPAALEVPLDGTLHARASYLAYEWLKQQQPFDVIQFPEINGVGFYSLQAKRLGLAFHQTHMCVVLHSPTLWHRTENREHVDREEDLALDFIERESVARADALISPTNYLLSWVSRWGFCFPDEVYVQPYVSHVAARRDDVSSRRVSELVFFGRLESRKGIELFCDALDILRARGALEGTRVTFLGKIGRVGLEDGASYARRRSDQSGLPVRLETALGQKEAIEYLRGRPAVAVMPSLADNMPYTVLECLAEGIPFISTTAGGIPEMVASEDHAKVLAAPEPSALAGLIERSLREGASPARVASDPDAVRREWIAWHELLAARTIRAPAAPAARPLVSVCIATRNRPKTLQQALDTIRAQTYAPVEVVLVDDASDREEALEALERLEPEFAGRGWQIVRRPVKGLPSAARNTAAAHAHGEYLLFMDDDNLARPHEVESFVAASLHSGVPLITCVVDHFRDEHGTNGAPTPTMRWLPLGPALTLGIAWNTFGDTNMLVRRDTFLGLGGFDEDAEAAFVEDWIFLTRAALAGVEMAVMPEPLFWYRVWDGANGQRQSHRASLHRRLVPYLNAESPDRRALTLYAAGLRDCVVTLRQESEAARQHVEALHRSWSWRITAPCRRLYELLYLGRSPAARDGR